MPYSKLGDLPEHVHSKPEAMQRKWMAVYNTAHAKAMEDGDEPEEAERKAMMAANAVLAKQAASAEMPASGWGLGPVVSIFAGEEDDGGKWNRLAPIFEGTRHRVLPLAADSRGKEGQAYGFSRKQAEEAMHNFVSVQHQIIPLLLMHPLGKDGPPEDKRKMGEVRALRIDAAGEWLEGRIHYTPEGRDLVNSGKFDQGSPTIAHNIQDMTGKPCGACIIEASLVSYPEFRDQGRLAAAGDTHLSPDGEEHHMPTKTMQFLGVETEDALLSAVTQIKARADAAPNPKEFVAVATYSALKAEHDALTGRVLAMEGQVAARKAEELYQVGYEAGKLVPAQREGFVKWATTSYDAAAEFLATAQPVLEYREHGSANTRRGKVVDGGSPRSVTVAASAELHNRATELQGKGQGITYAAACSQVLADDPELAARFTADIS